MGQHYKWIYPETQEIPQELLEVAGSDIVAQLLLNRNIDTAEKARAFLSFEKEELSSPYVFPDMEKTVDRLLAAIESGESVVVYGDFDADGVTGTSVLYKTLKYLGANVTFYIPDRTEEGHGLNTAAVCKLISSRQARIIITVDCGINNIAEVHVANSFKADVIITDHHEPPEILPHAYAIINPKVATDGVNLEYLSGAGVAYKLSQALLEKLGKDEWVDEILYIAAIGTVADVVPLVGENRYIVREGLKLIKQKRPIGLVKLLESAGFKADKDVTSETIAFMVAPRINAIGRLENAGIAVKLLVSEDAVESEKITKELDHNNRMRQQMCENTFIEANIKVGKEIDLVRSKPIILASETWHPGIIGIVASKLVEKYYRPVFLMSIDSSSQEARCSARGIKGLNLYDSISEYAPMFKKYGGHAMAAGFTLDTSKMSFEKFRASLVSSINSALPQEELLPTLFIDSEIESSRLCSEFIEEVGCLAPFGESNPYPIFSIKDLTIKQYKTMGANNNHLKIFFCDDDGVIIEAVWWQKSYMEFNVTDKVDVAFVPEINTFGGKSRIQLIVKDIKPVKESEFRVSKEEDEVKWIDHRDKEFHLKFVADQITAKDAIVFAECPESVAELKKIETISGRVVDRFSVKAAEEFFLFDCPPDAETLASIVRVACPKVIHVLGRYYDLQPVEFIKKVSGMMKYASVNMNGSVNVELICSKMGVSVKVVLACLRLLHQSGVIQVSKKEGNNIEFKFVGSQDLGLITGQGEYNNFIDAVENENVFKNTVSTASLKLLKSMCGQDFYTSLPA